MRLDEQLASKMDDFLVSVEPGAQTTEIEGMKVVSGIFTGVFTLTSAYAAYRFGENLIDPPRLVVLADTEPSFAERVAATQLNLGYISASQTANLVTSAGAALVASTLYRFGRIQHDKTKSGNNA